MKKSIACRIIGLVGIPVFILFLVFFSAYLSPEANLVLILGFSCGWGFVVMIPVKYFEKQENKSAINGSES